jgi:hypothetical protein
VTTTKATAGTATMPVDPPSGSQDPLLTIHVHRPRVDPGKRSNPAGLVSPLLTKFGNRLP